MSGIPRPSSNFDRWVLGAVWRLRQDIRPEVAMSQLREQFGITEAQAADAVGIGQQLIVQGQLARDRADWETVGRAFAIGERAPEVVNVNALVPVPQAVGGPKMIAVQVGATRANTLDEVKEMAWQMANAKYPDSIGGANQEDIVLEMAY